jgi:hypothetical protein
VEFFQQNAKVFANLATGTRHQVHVRSQSRSSRCSTSPTHAAVLERTHLDTLAQILLVFGA